MATYDYPNKITCPNMEGIHTDVAASAMADKAITGCRWDESDDILHVIFDNTLSGADKTILDGIVANNS